MTIVIRYPERRNIVVRFTGKAGPPGKGLPAGGSIRQVLRKATGDDRDTEWGALAKADVGLGNVDNTADAAKPVSMPQQTAIDSAREAAKTHAVQRSNHTGTQAISTVDGLQAALDAHSGAVDPHAQYLNQARGDARYTDDIMVGQRRLRHLQQFDGGVQRLLDHLRHLVEP